MASLLLIIATTSDAIEGIRSTLSRTPGYELEVSRNLDSIEDDLARYRPDLVLWDCGGDSKRITSGRRLAHTSVPFLALVPNDCWRKTAGAYRLATDFLLLPATDNELLVRIGNILSARERLAIEQSTVTLEAQCTLDQLVGNDPEFQRLRALLPVIARADASVMITGETGTGKELVARALHYLSPRGDGPFIPINCGALSMGIFESELFGHVKGAFTGAVQDRRGYFAQADGGTLFLDEIDTMPLPAQVKLLRALQSKSFVRVGGERMETTDVRIVAASNTDLPRCMDEGTFRADLFYRLNIIPVKLPPLRERRRDIPMLINVLAKKYAEAYQQPPRVFTPRALETMMRLAWPGNIRELENVVHRAVVIAAPGPIGVDALPLDGASQEDEADDEASTFREAKQAAIRRFERAYVLDLLQIHDGNITKAAATAGTDRRVFGRLVKRHHLEQAALAARNGANGTD